MYGCESARSRCTSFSSSARSFAEIPSMGTCFETTWLGLGSGLGLGLGLGLGFWFLVRARPRARVRVRVMVRVLRDHLLARGRAA